MFLSKSEGKLRYTLLANLNMRKCTELCWSWMKRGALVISITSNDSSHMDTWELSYTTGRSTERYNQHDTSWVLPSKVDHTHIPQSGNPASGTITTHVYQQKLQMGPQPNCTTTKQFGNNQNSIHITTDNKLWCIHGKRFYRAVKMNDLSHSHQHGQIQ